MEVDSESRNLLRKTEEIDGGVQQARAELGVQVNGTRAVQTTVNQGTGTKRGSKKNLRIEGMREVGDVDQSDDMQRELEKHRQQNIKIEDIAKRSFSRQFLNRLKENK